VASRPPTKDASGRLSVELAHYYARIYAAAKAGCIAELRYGGCNEEEAEELFAATLEQIMAKRDPPGEGFAPAQTVALLKQACRQRLIDERRHRGVVQVVPLAAARARTDRTRESPAEAAEDRDAVAIGREAISSLPKRHRQLFLQRHRLGLSPEEILRRNPGLSQRTYRRIMQRANAGALAAFEQISSGERCAEMRGGQLRRYITEEASEAELRAIQAHLLHCRACGLEVARMRGHLHEVATGLAALLTDGKAHGHLVGDLPARLLEVAGHGGEALAGATRVIRERLREAAIRVATASPGPGGEGAAGQISGISGAKVASVCAAGAISAGCLAAGVVPGVGGLELAGQQRATRHSESVKRVASPPQQRLPAEASPSSDSSAAPQQNPKRTSSTGGKGGSTRAAHPSSSEARSTRPTISGQQTGTEFGAEAAGTGVPAPTLSSGSSGTSSGGGSASGSGSTGSSGSESNSKPEFGL
jgi:DNA-directed RNA polymerase specialized sigma24 family protein